MNWLLIKKLCLIPMALLVMALVGDAMVFSFVEYGHKGKSFVGCYAYDSMLLGFKCNGFMGRNLITLWLNWPLWLFYGPMFAVFSFRAFAVAVLAWSPIALYLVSIFKLRRSKNA